MNIRVDGDNELAARLDPAKVLGGPFRRMLDRSGITVANRAKRNTPVWQGRARASIAHEVDTAPIPLWVKIGSNVAYMPFLEEDTRPHWPPLAAIAPWAKAHGIAPFLVARAISRRGTKGRHMLANGLRDSESDIRGFADRIEQEVKAEIEGS